MRSLSGVRKNRSRSGSPFWKRKKKLAAICEEEYNRNHGEAKDGDGVSGSACADSKLRRSSRIRRAPVILDASPSPATKRRRKHENGNVNRSTRDSLGRVAKEESGDLDSLGGWKSRLRSRRRNIGFQATDRESNGVKRNRRLFDEQDFDEVGDKTMAKETEEGKSRAPNGQKTMRAERLAKAKEPQSSGDCSDHSDTSNSKDESVNNSDESTDDESEVREEDKNKLTTRVVNVESETEVDADGMDSETEGGTEKTENDTEDSDEGRESETEDSDEEMESETEESAEKTGNETVVVMDGIGTDANTLPEVVENDSDNRMEGVEDESASDIANGKPEENSNFVDEVPNEKEDTSDPQLRREVCMESNESLEQNGAESLKMNKKSPIKKEAVKKVIDSVFNSTERLGKPCFKQGRRCGLCGVGTDGKPPKKSRQDNGDSDIEIHSGSSTSEEPNYDVLDGFGDDPGWLGRLLGPINDRYGIAGTWVHQHCAVWSPEVYFAGLGCLKNVRAALCRGRSLKCTRCGRPGATIGCRVDRCPRTYHLPCARANGCIFDHRKFLIACTDHRYLFQPHGRQCRARMKKMKTKRMRLEMRKVSNDAWKKDLEAEEKWFEKCGEDEEFLKRESKRLHRDLLRVAPVYIGGLDSENGKGFEGWDSVAGLEKVVQCMKEVVLLPLLYPEFFDNLGLTPPRGVLLHGHPGTGKTLVVRALIGSLARGHKRIAYFARKGADCLGKYVGDAERQLRLLFQVAEKCQPSIIFFDEIDGLAPRRTRQQDQTHSSVVSTLLALLDGLKSRGSVVVIGATNCPDAIDPALRRPGRFDREIYFPLPSSEDRAAIISLHTNKWPKPVSGYSLKWIARETAGFAGADLQALCTQAAMIALKRNFPLQDCMNDAQLNIPGAKRATLPDFSVEERDWLEALLQAPPPCSRRGAGIAACDIFSSPLPIYLAPSLLRPLCSLLVALHLDDRVSLPPSLSKAATDVQNVILSSLSSKKLTSDCWWIHLSTLLEEVDVAKEVVRKLSFAGLMKGGCEMTESDTSTISTGHCNLGFEQSKACICPHPRLMGNVSFESRSKSGFQVLIGGSHKSGQRHLASCILHCFIGEVEVQKIDMATLALEGNGNLVQGLTQLLSKCTSGKSCVVFVPRIDLWAVETLTVEGEDSEDMELEDGNEKENSSPSSDEKSKEETIELHRVSHLWNTFVEQIESLRISSTIIILATSGASTEVLPDKIKQFFKTDLSQNHRPTSCDAVPQFCVQVSESFDSELTISLSAAELSRRAIQLFVQSIHQRAHSYPLEYPTQGYRETPEQKDTCPKSKLPDDCSVKKPLLPIGRNVKAKSSLQLSIATFGYQILRYPHFAELCWVTSKLKEGPSADASGPWRGWPFNSCIIRPCNSHDQAAAAAAIAAATATATAAGSSNNSKGKELSGIVRGLIAVGLSAYRGIYGSLREVSFEVRTVLELLVGRINDKINSGKDRRRYVRILSQVSYLEDLVNSWAYAMRSFESNSQTELPNSTPSVWIENMVGKDSADNHQPQPVVETINDHVEINPATHSGFDLNKENGDGFSQEDVTLDLNRPAVDQQQHETHGGSNDVETREGESIGSDKAGSPSDFRAQDLNSTPSAAVCSYRCCPHCLSALQDLMRKLVTRELGMGKRDITTEGVHDAVSSLSLEIMAAMRDLISGDDNERKECSWKSSAPSSSLSWCDDDDDDDGVMCFRDGILVPAESSEKDPKWHCKYEQICLCSLIASLPTRFNPF